MKKLATMLLGVWLILRGLMTLAEFSFQGSSTVLAILAVVAGTLLILADWSEKFSTHLADFALGTWLILAGIVPLFDLHFRGSHAVFDVVGLVAGVLTALALTRVMASLVVGIKPTDPLTFVAIAALFFFVALLASWLPAWRASRLAPTVALHQD